MDVEQYLIRQGWRKGEGLRPHSLKRPILVKHRKDNKGLGFNPQQSEGWWERVFDGHLKSLGVSKENGVSLEFDEEKRRRETSPLYASFLSGGVLQGSIEKPKMATSAGKLKKRDKRKTGSSKPAPGGDRVHKKSKDKKSKKERRHKTRKEA